jgi:integrase
MGWFKRERRGKKYYYATFMVGEGADRRQEQEYSGKSKEGAIALAAKREREVRDGTYSKERRTGAVTVASYATTWGESRRNKTAGDDRARLRDHVVPHIGHMRMMDVTPPDILRLMQKLSDIGAIEPSTIHNVFGTLSAMFRDAVFFCVVAATPCVLLKGALPAIPKKPKTIYEKQALRALLLCPDVPADRRVYYALASLTGMRHGECAGRKWSDWQTDTSPLTCLAVDTQYDGEILKAPDGESRPRRVPVHPTLANVLWWWKREGFAQVFGRSPRPDDFIVPSRRGPEHHRTVRRSLANLTENRKRGAGKAGERVSDCTRAGIKALTFHRFRDTFISLARRDGARKDVLERVTHNAQGDIVDGYTLFDWAPLCEAVLALKFDLAGPPQLGPGGSHDTDHTDGSPTVYPGESGGHGEAQSLPSFPVLPAVSARGGRVRVPSAPLSLQPDSAVESPPDERCHTKCHNGSPEADADYCADDGAGDPDEAAFVEALREPLGAAPFAARPSAGARPVPNHSTGVE